MIQKKIGKITFGAGIMSFVPADIDTSLSDEVVYMAALGDAINNAGGHRSFMRENGFVRRNTLGHIQIQGEGWIIDFKSEEFITEFNRLKDSKDWVAFAALSQFDTVTSFDNKGNKKP